MGNNISVLKTKIQILKLYFSLWINFFKTSLVADLEFRVNFSTRIITDIFWYMAQIVTFEVLFIHTKTIGHWNLEQTRVFLGVLFIIDAIYMILIHDNLDRMSEKIRKGDLDLILSKPINSQFMISFQRVGTASLGNLIMALAWLYWALSRIPNYNWWKISWLLVLIPAGFCFIYATRFMFSSMALIFTRAESVQFVWFQIYKIGMRPDTIYLPWFRYFILSLVPVGLIVSVPARFLLDPPDVLLFLWTALLAPFFIYLSNKFWNYCLRYYSSASS